MSWDTLREQWYGPRGYWWALIAGIVLIPLTVGIAAILAAAFDQNLVPITALGLIIELLAISLIGSGMIEGASRRLISDDDQQGTPAMPGMSRRKLHPPPARSRTDDEEEEEEDPEVKRQREEQERKTLQMGLMAFPVLVTFLVLLFS